MSNAILNNIAGMVEGINGATFIGIDTITTPKLKGGKKNPMAGRITKKMTGAVVEAFTNKNSNGYANMVNRRLEKEGKEGFTLSARAWGHRIAGEPIIEHTNKEGETKYYLEMIFLKAGKVEYFLDGEKIAKEDIVGLPEERDEGKQGNLENKVIIRTFDVNSIVGMRIGGHSYSGKFIYAKGM